MRKTCQCSKKIGKSKIPQKVRVVLWLVGFQEINKKLLQKNLKIANMQEVWKRNLRPSITFAIVVCIANQFVILLMRHLKIDSPHAREMPFKDVREDRTRWKIVCTSSYFCTQSDRKNRCSRGTYIFLNVLMHIIFYSIENG